MPKRTLIIPDIHGQLSKLRIIEDTFAKQVERVVCLGDWFDSFTDYDATAVCQWILDHPEWEKLLGNHDCHYFFHGQGWACSGYSGITQLIVDEMLPLEVKQQFKVSTYVGHYLCTHAGYHPLTMGRHLFEDEALDMAWQGQYSKLWEPGQARSGRSAVGGPTWLDWNYEFTAMEQRQIVGHTHETRHVRTKIHPESLAVSYCIDTGLNNIMIVDEDTNEVELHEL